MRTRWVTLGAVLLIALSACGWTQPGFDSGRSNSNPFETGLTPSNVGQLVDHVIPGPVTSFAPLVLTFADKVLIGRAPGGVDAYTRSDCPRSDNGACTSRWHKAGYLLGTDGFAAFVTTGATTFSAFDTDGMVKRQYDTAAAAGFSVTGLKATASFLLVTLVKPSPTPTTRDTEGLAVFSRSCATATCTPDRTLQLFTQYGSNFRWAAQGSVLYSAGPETFGNLTARDLTSGATLWSTNGAANDVRFKDGLLYATGGYVYDASGGQGCTGTPKVCSPIRRLTNAYEVDSVSGQLAMDHVVPDGYPLPPSDIRFWRTDGAGCNGAPAVCAAVARTITFDAIGEPISTDQLVFAVNKVTFFASHYHLLAFDPQRTAGCTSSPTVCSPLVDIDFSTDVPGTPTAIADGRVYVPLNNGAVHVFSLPGDVS